MVDGTGLRPTTDGSLNADKYANDYMIATYYKQQASAHPEMTQPAPEPPKTTRGKWSKNTFKTELPVNFRYYNVDHTEFQSPFEYADKYGNITNPPTEDTLLGKDDIINVFSNVILDTVVTSYSKISEGILKATSHTTFKSITKSLLLKSSRAFIGVGFIADVEVQIKLGENIVEALIASTVHSIVAYGISTICMTYISPVIISTFMAIVLSAVINTVIDKFLFKR